MKCENCINKCICCEYATCDFEFDSLCYKCCIVDNFKLNKIFKFCPITGENLFDKF